MKLTTYKLIDDGITGYWHLVDISATEPGLMNCLSYLRGWLYGYDIELTTLLSSVERSFKKRGVLLK